MTTATTAEEIAAQILSEGEIPKDRAFFSFFSDNENIASPPLYFIRLVLILLINYFDYVNNIYRPEGLGYDSRDSHTHFYRWSKKEGSDSNTTKKRMDSYEKEKEGVAYPNNITLSRNKMV